MFSAREKRTYRTALCFLTPFKRGHFYSAVIEVTIVTLDVGDGVGVRGGVGSDRIRFVHGLFQFNGLCSVVVIIFSVFYLQTSSLVCMCACVRACVRACVCACVCVCVFQLH